MTTDNRTNEPTSEQVEVAFEEGMDAIDWGMVRNGEGDPQEAAGIAVRAALVAAQGAAPQAEAYDHCCNHPKCPGGSLCCCVSVQRLRDCWNQWREEIAGDSRQAFHDGYQAGQNDPAPWLAAPVLPSSGVDEDALAEVIARASVVYSPMLDEEAQNLARAVAAWLKGQGGESRG